MATMIRWSRPSVLCLSLLIAACAQRDGVPALRQAGPPETEAAGNALVTDCRDPSRRVDGLDTRSRRNQLAALYLAAADAAYEDFRRRLAASSGRDRPLRALALPRLSRPRRGDAELSNGLTARGRIGREALSDQVLALILTQMDASRSVQRAIIVRRLRLPVEAWNACAALSDLAAYEQAGSVEAAIAALADSAARAREAAEAEILEAIPPQ